MSADGAMLPPDMLSRADQLRAADSGSSHLSTTGTLPLDNTPSPRTPAHDVTEFPDVPGYEILEQLGEGGMGVVYKARHLGLNRLVALKMLRGGYGSAEDRRRFRGEAEAVARLQHPNIVQIFDVGEAQGRLYCALEFVTGGSLDRRLRRSAIPSREAARLAADLARAAQAVNELGLVHRDLKPANVLLTADGVPKVTDFGLAKFLNDPARPGTASGDVLGTPSYMAPEQAAGRADKVTAATDVYGLGAILYECLTGRPPFKAATTAETIAQVRTQEPVPVRQLQPSVPRDLEAICLKCLRKRPRHRYASARALMEDLQRFLDGRPVQARPVTLAVRAWRWARRRPALASMVGLLLVAVVALVAGGWWASVHVAVAAGRAELAEAEAEAARQQVAAQEFVNLISDVRDSKARPTPGWTWDAADNLRRAAALSPARGHLVELRSELAECLATPDVREQKALVEGFKTGQMCFNPTGKRLALAEAFHGWYCTIKLLNASTGDLERTLTFPSSTMFAAENGKADGTSALAFSPDGRWLVAAARSGALHRWDLTADKPEVVSWPGHAKEIEALAFSPDGNALYSSCLREQKLKRWDVPGGWKATVERQATTRDLVVHPSGELLTCDAGSIVFVSLDTLQPVNELKVSSHGRLALSTSARVLAATNGRDIALVNVELGKVVRHLRRPSRETAHEASISGVAFSPDDSLLLSWDSGTGHVRLWEVASGRLVADWAAPGAHLHDPRSAFHPDGRLVVAAGKCTRLYEVGGVEVQARLMHHARPVLGFTLAPDGQSALCLAGDDDRKLTRWTLDGDAARPAGRLAIDTNPRFDVAPAVHPDGRVAAFAAGGRVGTWDLGEGAEGPGFVTPELASLCFDPDGRPWGAGTSQVHSWEFPQGKPAKSWCTSQYNPLPPLPAVTSLAAGRRGVLAGGQTGTVSVLGVAEGRVRSVAAGWTLPTRAAVDAVAWNADESVAAFGNRAGEVLVVRPDSGEKPVKVGTHQDVVTGVAFDRGGLLATGGRDGVVRLWQPGDDGFSEELVLRMPGPVASLAFTPDGLGLAVLVEGEYAVRMWRLDRLRGKLADAGL